MSKEQKQRKMVTMDGNEAVASVAHRTNEVIAIYPITPSSNMGEWADEWSATGKKNIWGIVPTVVEMQSEGGAAGAVHGALQARRADDDLHGVAGPAAHDPQHVQDRRRADAVRACTCRRAPLATHALSIFGDHSDVMAVPADRLRPARLQLGAGGPRLRAHRPARHAEEPRALPPLLRRLPHLARGGQDRAARRRRPARR